MTRAERRQLERALQASLEEAATSASNDAVAAENAVENETLGHEHTNDNGNGNNDGCGNGDEAQLQTKSRRKGRTSGAGNVAANAKGKAKGRGSKTEKQENAGRGGRGGGRGRGRGRGKKRTRAEVAPLEDEDAADVAEEQEEEDDEEEIRSRSPSPAPEPEPEPEARRGRGRKKQVGKAQALEKDEEKEPSPAVEVDVEEKGEDVPENLPAKRARGRKPGAQAEKKTKMKAPAKKENEKVNTEEPQAESVVAKREERVKEEAATNSTSFGTPRIGRKRSLPPKPVEDTEDSRTQSSAKVQRSPLNDPFVSMPPPTAVPSRRQWGTDDGTSSKWGTGSELGHAHAALLLNATPMAPPQTSIAPTSPAIPLKPSRIDSRVQEKTADEEWQQLSEHFDERFRNSLMLVLQRSSKLEPSNPNEPQPGTMFMVCSDLSTPPHFGIAAVDGQDAAPSRHRWLVDWEMDDAQERREDVSVPMLRRELRETRSPERPLSWFGIRPPSPVTQPRPRSVSRSRFQPTMSQPPTQQSAQPYYQQPRESHQPMQAPHARIVFLTVPTSVTGEQMVARLHELGFTVTQWDVRAHKAKTSQRPQSCMMFATMGSVQEADRALRQFDGQPLQEMLGDLCPDDMKFQRAAVRVAKAK